METIFVDKNDDINKDINNREKTDGKQQKAVVATDEMNYPSGIKWTKQRKSVYRVLWEAGEPLSAVRIYHLASRGQDGERYAPSTIYRILAAFEENGLVEKNVWMEDGTVVYGLNRGAHTHYAVCLGCRKRIQLQECPFAHVHLEQEEGGFTVTGHKLELYGYCGECRDKAENYKFQKSSFKKIKKI